VLLSLWNATGIAKLGEILMEQLTNEQKGWLTNIYQNQPDVYEDIHNFLENDISPNGLMSPDANYNVEAIQFAIEAIISIHFGGEVYFEEAYIPVDTPDDNYVYQGSKELIPNPLILSNGTQISITFGTTNDNINANQPVAIDLIIGMKFAIQEANSNLSASNQITSIYISATTNGHGTTGPSNHLKATAVDISRLNGNKMALTGVTPQIIELQKAMDNYEYIRENFGPNFKHKYSIESDSWNYNHPVSGHTDHIHFSIRR